MDIPLTELDALAQEVGVHGRTLRRAAERGLLRGNRRGAREVVVPPSERRYVRAHWQLFRGLLEALRKQHNVRLAVLFGSVARGSAGPQSDLDLLVRLRRDDHVARAAVADALREASGRPVQLVSVTQAEGSPLLLADVLRDGRVLVDRDGDWRRLRRGERRTFGRARVEDERLQALAWEAPAALEEIAAGMSIAAR
jgi:predicted nucleotidyltransferase